MPPARTAPSAKGVDLYLAPTADARDAWYSTTRHIAPEGRCRVLTASRYVAKGICPRDLGPEAPTGLELAPEVLCRGGGAILHADLDHDARPDPFSLGVDGRPRRGEWEGIFAGEGRR